MKAFQMASASNKLLDEVEDVLKLRKDKLAQKYEFDFDQERPLPQAHPSIAYAPISSGDLPLYLRND